MGFNENRKRMRRRTLPDRTGLAAHEAVQRAIHETVPEVRGHDRRQPLDASAHALWPLRYVDGVGSGSDTNEQSA